jgi:uncharacterized protein YbcC (UPF0753/DUF2309 family)
MSEQNSTNETGKILKENISPNPILLDAAALREAQNSSFDEQKALQDLRKFLPAQAPLKDFIFQNGLEAFQNLSFFKGLNTASAVFGYKVFLSLKEFRSIYQSGRIREDVLERIISEKKGAALAKEWKEKLLSKEYETSVSPRIGLLKANWKKEYKIDLDSLVHPILFRILCSYLDQGISIWNFPLWENGFLSSIREMEQKSFTSFFKTKRAKKLLLNNNCELHDLLKIVVGDESLFKQYLFDQQFAHQGWSGMVSVIEHNPHTLIDTKKISLKEVIIYELLLEIDALDRHFGEDKWPPLSTRLKSKPIELFADIPETELNEVLSIWQLAFEWSYYDQVLAGLQIEENMKKEETKKNFQAMFCIDDRECSLRRYVEKFDPACETFGTPGFFNVEFYFQPENGKYYTKLCPAPVTPKYLIKEVGTHEKRAHDAHFTKETHSLFGGMLISQTLGFWSALRLVLTIFKPTMSTTAASSFRHMNKAAKLTIVNTDPNIRENDLQIGFTLDEMVQRVEGLLRSIGLVKNFAPLVYVIGHGASSVNNPYYTTMDCGACSCRPGSVNARVLCFMANHPEVRSILATKGIVIPAGTQFVGGLHDTTRDDIIFFDEDVLDPAHVVIHQKNQLVFDKSLDFNAKERSRRFESISTKQNPEKIHEQIRTRSVSIFEPRPELDHATNALTIIGRRSITKDLFLDRRSFMNSYDYKSDPEGNFLFGIMKPIAPVCGGINLSYYFARVDNQKLGAGTKLPHNVMGLIGVANGIDGDLRPGLPNQMVESHDPVRQLVVVEHFPEVVLETIKKLPNYEWYLNNWMHIVALNPETGIPFVFKEGVFVPYEPLTKKIDTITDLTAMLENSDSMENLPVYLIS